MAKILLLIISACGIIVLAIHSCKGKEPAISEDAKMPPTDQSSTEKFHCEGKVRCHEMVSCEEADFYLAHCPNVEIDGDGDGRPCEDMCGH
jgi:hypothetical protein